MPLARRWVGQDAYDAEFTAAAAQCPAQVSVPLLKALAAQESGFDPRAFNPSDPPTGAYGLMQMIEPTARGLGYTGPMVGLYNPALAVQLGAALMCENLARSGVVADSISAYNGGWRSVLGYGSVLPSGRYANQAYVDSILEKLRYFEQWEREKRGELAPVAPLLLLAGLAAAGVAYQSGAFRRRPRRSARPAGR
jgi:hypothetical protein